MNLFQNAPASLKKAWLLTFTDLISLLLTFLVMLYAMGTPHIFENTKGPTSFIGLGGNEKTFSLVNKQSFMKRSVNLNYLYKVLTSERIKMPEYSFKLSNDRLTLLLPPAVFMDAEKLVLEESFQKDIQELGYLFNNLSNKIAVVGYSSESQWEKGMRFAASIANELKKGGYKDDIPVFSKLFSPNTQEGYIEILIYPYNKERLL